MSQPRPIDESDKSDRSDRERAWEVVATACGSRPWEGLQQRARERLGEAPVGEGSGEPGGRSELAVAEGERRVRVIGTGDGADTVAILLHGVGFRWVTVRLYPNPGALERWSDFGRPGLELPVEVWIERLGGLGRRPQVMAPLLASAVLGLCLERLGGLDILGASLVAGAVALLCLALAISARRGRIEWVRFRREG